VGTKDRGHLARIVFPTRRSRLTQDDKVAAVTQKFSDLMGALNKDERARLTALLVERVTFEREKETVSISFHPSGFEALLEEQK